MGPKTARKIIKKEVAFDQNLHKDLLDLNSKLIALNTNLDLNFLDDLFAFRSDILQARNGEIFNGCGF